jgi:hypothetical protein
MVQDGLARGAANQRVHKETWDKAEPLDFLALFDVLYEEVYGFRPATLCQLTTKDAKVLGAGVKRLQRLLDDLYKKPDWVPVLTYTYTRWLLRAEDRGGEFAASKGATTRNPVTAERWLDPVTVQKWLASEHTRRRARRH